MIYEWSNKNVLVVEDSPINIELMVIMLSSTKINITISKNSTDFFNKIYEK